MLPELNKFYVNKNLSVRKCIHVAEEENNPRYRHMFIDSTDTINYAVKTEDFEKNFHELAFQCDIDTPEYENYKNHQFITELFELIIDKNSDYNIHDDWGNIKLNQSKDLEYVDLNYNDHKYIAKCSRDVAIIENIRQNKAKTLYNKIMALQNSGLLK